MRPQAIKLQFHTVGEYGERLTIAEAIDLETGDVVAAYTLAMMHAWLKRRGFSWLPGSSGIWQQERAA